MTVSSTTSRWTYTGDGTTTIFVYNNKIFVDADLAVYVDGTLKTLDTDYTVSGEGTDAGGNVTFTTAPASSAAIVIVRSLTNDQQQDLPAGGALPSSSVEDMADRRTIISQQQQEEIDRTLKKPVTGTHYDADGLKITNLAQGTADSDAVTKAQMEAEAAAAANGAVASSIIQNVALLTNLQDVGTSSFVGGELRYMKGRATVGDGAEGTFIWRTGDKSTEVAADEVTAGQGNGGIWIAPASDKTGASGAFERLYSGLPRMDWYAKGDDDGAGTGTDDSNAFDAALGAAHGSWVVLNPDKKYRITRELRTDVNIRLMADGTQLDADGGAVADGAKKAVIVCDGTSVQGQFDPDTNTLGSRQTVKGWMNIECWGINSAPFALHIQPTKMWMERSTFRDFLYHGLWTRGGSIVRIKDIDFYGCGRTDPTGAPVTDQNADTDITSVNYRRGCGWLAECSNTAAQATGTNDAGREASGNYRPTSFWVENIWSDANDNSALATLNTSPRDFILFGLLPSRIAGMGGYNGSWVGRSTLHISGPWLEGFASGGVVAGDGTPFDLVELDSSIRIDSPQIKLGHRRIRNTAFNAANDFWGYWNHQGPNFSASRMNIFELILGQDEKVDSGSTDWATFAARGSAANPSLYWDQTANALVGSRGNNHLPWVGFPIYEQLSTIAAAGGTADFTPATLLPDAPDPGTGVANSYEIEIMAGINSNEWYWSLWRCSRTSTKQKFVKVAEIDESSATITVTATGTGTSETLRVTNNRGSGDINASGKSRMMHNNSFTVSN